MTSPGIRGTSRTSTAVTTTRHIHVGGRGLATSLSALFVAALAPELSPAAALLSDLPEGVAGAAAAAVPPPGAAALWPSADRPLLLTSRTPRFRGTTCSARLARTSCSTCRGFGGRLLGPVSLSSSGRRRFDPSPAASCAELARPLPPKSSLWLCGCPVADRCAKRRILSCTLLSGVEPGSM